MDNYVPRLKKVYKETIAPALIKEFGYTTPMQVPAIKKIVVSMGVGEALTNKKLLDAAVEDLAQITGQHAVKTKARKSIANFKLREGNEVGARVTLNFWTASSTLRFRALRISAVSNRPDLTDTEIFLSALRNRLFSRKSISIKSRGYPA